MFFTECARLAEQHPDLASVFEQLDSKLEAMGTADVIRPDDIASFLNIDPNQVRSALDMFAQVGVLHRVEMIECTYCQMAALRSDYQEALDEYDEYRCTDCGRPLTDRTIQIITAYRRGEKWREAAIPIPPTRVARPSARGKGFAANAEDHRKVAGAVAKIGDDWMPKLPALCRELHRAGADVPRYWKEEEMVETWDEIAQAVEGPDKSSAREKVSAHIRYRLRWIRERQPGSQ
jgi:hypothetical protein